MQNSCQTKKKAICVTYLELSEALGNERKVNEELRNALDNDYDETEKPDEGQINVVKELQKSLTAVQVS